jgi:3',5'-cyclic AMP phosphodiesterase CpdA
MAVIYWFSDGAGVDVVKGGPNNDVPMPTILVRWIRSQSPDLIVYGGDVYKEGKPAEFAEFLRQMDGDVTRMCEPPGNHDWKDAADVPGKGRIPRGFEDFWSGHSESEQPIATERTGAARYDHFIDLGGWRLIFVDTGDYSTNPWPAGGSPDRKAWLKNTLKTGRANILFAHHSRIACGNHGHNSKLDELWRSLFDETGPRVALAVGGHDHNVNVYGPRSRNDPEGPPVPFAQGVHVCVNGAAGAGHYHCGSGILAFLPGEKGDIFSDRENYFVTRINLIDDRSIDLDCVSFGAEAKTAPVAVPQSRVKIRL